MNNINLSYQRLKNPKVYTGVQLFLGLCVVSAVALAIFKGHFSKWLDISQKNLRYIGIGAAGGFGVSMLATHVFWARRIKALEPEKMYTELQKEDSPSLDLNRSQFFQQLHEAFTTNTCVERNPDREQANYSYVPFQDYRMTVEKPLVRFPTSVIETIALKFGAERVYHLRKQLIQLDQLYIYQYVSGNGDCFFTALASGFLHNYLAAVLTDPRRAEKMRKKFEQQIRQSYPKGTFSYRIPCVDDLGVIIQGAHYGRMVSTEYIFQMLEDLKKNPSPTTLREILENEELLMIFTSFLRLYSVEDGLLKGETIIHQNVDGDALIKRMSSLFDCHYTQIDPTNGNDTQLTEFNIDRETIYPSPNPNIITVFFNGDHYDLLIPRETYNAIWFIVE